MKQGSLRVLTQLMQISVVVVLSSCFPIVDHFPPFQISPFSFGIFNETSVDISVELRIGEIPSFDAPLEAFSPYQDNDYVYFIGSELWSTEQVLRRVINAGESGYVYTCLPLYKLYWMGRTQDFTELKARLLNKLISFTLTISRGEEVLYTIAGWDVPDENKRAKNINDTLYGYYDTAKENWIDTGGTHEPFPLLYSKFWNGKSAFWPEDPEYIITVSPDSGIVTEFTPYATDYYSGKEFIH
jgi:hypothetical protein